MQSQSLAHPDIAPGRPHAPPCGPLASQTIHSLRAFFQTTQHHPSPEHWEALEDIARTLEAMADGDCPTRVFLSAIDPGIGKSQTTLHFAKALMNSQSHAQVGMLVCVGRITEAMDYAGALEAFGHKVAVLINETDARKHGGAALHDPSQAQVLITTQQRLELATSGAAGGASDGRAFSEVPSLQFQGKPREVRVWDEAWLPGVAVSLGRDEVASMFGPARAISPAFAGGLEGLWTSLKDAQTGDVVSVPDWGELYGVTQADLLGALGDDGKARDDHHQTAVGLFILSGKRARVWRDNKDGGAVLTYRDTLPRDLAPLLVLDASGRVRQTYADMVEHRGLVKLRTAVKDYSPLKVHVWRTGGSKSAWEARGANLAQGVADTILTRPDENWLVVVHKAGSKVGNPEKSISKLLPPEILPRVSFITWGQHMATNAYADTENIILAGTLFMAPGHYVALTHLSQDKPTEPGLASLEEVERTTRGEHAHLILQALCRGRVRRSDGARCFPMNAYVIASAKSGIMETLPDIFPGCSLLDWRPGPPEEPTGKLKEAIEIIGAEVASGVSEISLAAVRDGLSMSNGSFKKRILDDPRWEARLEGWGLRVEIRKRGAKVLVRSLEGA